MKTRYLLIAVILFVALYTHAQGPYSRTEAKIDQVHEDYGLSGNGVLSVVMDRGVDYTHPDFIDQNGNTRIAYIFDLYDNTGAGDPDNPFGVGTIYDETEINESLAQGGTPLVNDIFGHGTATTGIFAGNGGAIQDSAMFRGVAYESRIISIIVTKDYVPPFEGNPGQMGQYNPGILPIAFEFAEDKIEELGMPSVTLLNIGSIGQPTDGSIGFCELVDAYTQKGHPFVCGVGDDGGQDNHMIEELALNTTSTFEINKGENGFLRFVGWYDDNARCNLRVERPDGTIEGPFDPPGSANDSKDVFLNQINIYHRGANVEFDNSSANWRQLMIDFTGAPGVYKVHLETTELSSESVFHAMLNPSRHYNENKFINFGESGGNINGFSSCFTSISPTDYVANNSYVDVDGITRTYTGQGNVGELWIGSSVGPTMDDRIGVDIASPGELAIGAYSPDSYYGSFSFNTLENSEGFYGIQNAVSGAAPILAGVIALMLEVNPALTPEELKTFLQDGAEEDNFTGTTPNVIWGHGKLDALASIQLALETVSAHDLELENENLTVFPNPVESKISILANDHLNKNIHCSIYAADGLLIFQDHISTKDQIDLNHLKSGVYFMQISSGENIYTQKIVKL